jgi:hypothetical protein
VVTITGPRTVPQLPEHHNRRNGGKEEDAKQLQGQRRLIYHYAMMSLLARVDSYPECRHIESLSISSNFGWPCR